MNPTSPRCWAHHKWVEDGLDDEGHHKVTDAMEVGWANVASAPGSLYNVVMTANGQTVPLTTTPVTGTQTLITAAALGSTWCTPGGSTLGVAPVGGGVGTTLPPPDFCIDPINGITYTYTFAAYATDHLGTVRAILTTNPDGTTGLQTFDYEPFGVEIPGGNTGCDNTHRFTGHERDIETGNDYMHARYCANSMGRFLSPDPVWGKLNDPQSWNLYSYVRNRPTVAIDPDGRVFKLDSDEKKRKEQLDLLKKSLHNDEAAKHVVAVQDKKGNWVVAIQGISKTDFNKLGTSAHGLNHLVNSGRDYSLQIGPSQQASAGGGAASDKGVIYVDPGMLPIKEGNVEIDAATAVAHEIGHQLENEFGKSYIQGISERAGRNLYVKMKEGFATTYENFVRQEAQPKLPEREWYKFEGDYSMPDVQQIIP